MFAYEGSVSLTIRTQQPKGNPAKGTTTEEERHPATKDRIASLFRLAGQCGVWLDWID